MMQWLQANWVLIVLGAAFIGMHLFMHGAHSHGGSNKTEPNEPPKANDENLHNHGG